MAEAIRMPLLSDTMKEGKIIAWHKKVGDSVKSDDVIAEVETDKATMEVMPYVDGTLLYIGTEAGTAAKVNDIIAIVGKQGEDYKSLLDSPAPAEEKPAEAPKPAANEPQTMPEAKAPEADKKSSPLSGDATVVRMPLLSDTMKEGKIVAWHKKVGDKVKSDDAIADVETDKATMEVMPYADGTLLYIGVKEGEAAPINGIIAIVGKEGTDIQPYLDAPAPDSANAQPAQPAQAAQPAQTAATNGQVAQQPQQSAAPASDNSGTDERLKASPLAKRMAKDKGIDLNALHGSGDNGRIVKRDVEEFKGASAPVPAKTAAAPQAQVQAFAATGQEGYTDKPNSQMRNIIAQRLSESKNAAPHFYLRMTVNMDGAIAARTKMNEVSPVKISFNDLIIKACAMALRQHPEVNSSWMGQSIRTWQHIHIGTAVAIEDGLIVPVVKFADQKSLSQIAQEAGTLIEKARNKKLQPPEFTGNTFTISNLGMMDIDEFTAIINPPDACILAVGKIAETPVAEKGQVVIRNLLKLTLSCDHRVVDGAVGSRFLQTLKGYLEEPVSMLV